MFWSELVDDAAVLPPGAVPLERAVREHREHLASEYADLVGALVVRDTDLADLRALLDPDRPLSVTVVVTGGAGAIEPAVRWSSGDGVRLRRLRVALREGAGEGDDLARNARRVAAMVAHCGAEAPVHVEVPRVDEHSWLSALDEVATAGLALWLRADDDLAGSVDAALDRETPFVVEGGGVCDALAATSTSLLGTADVDGWESARRWLLAVACPDVMEVHDDLVEHGLWRTA